MRAKVEKIHPSKAQRCCKITYINTNMIIPVSNNCFKSFIVDINVMTAAMLDAGAQTCQICEGSSGKNTNRTH